MPLRFDLAIGERLYIGRGVIMSNKSRMFFVLDGDMPVLKEKDYLAPEAARTALERLYAHVQTAYLHESPATEFRALAALAAAEAPEIYANLTEVDALVAAGDLYRALKSIRNLSRGRRRAISGRDVG
jgi:flagellar protein FlbT